MFTEIRGDTVIAHLHARCKDAVYTKAQAKILLDFFAAGCESYARATLQQLRELPIFPVATDVIRAVNSALYRPTDFSPPSLGLTVHLLEQHAQWENLCALLGIQPLENRRFLEEMVLPALRELSDSDRWSAWEWIRKHYWAVILENGDEDLRIKLGAACVPARDGALYPIRDLHDPRSEVIAEVFGDEARYPDVSSRKDPESWLKFFGMLGLISSPRPAELLNHIDKLAAEGLAAEPRLRNVWNFIVKNWENLSQKTIKYRQAGAVSFPECLSRRTWFPAMENSNKPGFQAPEARFYRSNELHETVELVGSQAPVIRWNMPAAISKALGVQRTPPPAIVLDHFDFLLDMWEHSERASFDLEAFDLVIEHVYDYIGKLGGESNTRLLSTVRVRLQGYRSRQCLWDRHEHCFWTPSRVFGTPVPFFEPRRTYLEGWPQRCRAAFELMGSRNSPTDNDFIEFLRELASTNGCVSETQRKQALHAFKELSTAKIPADLPLLTREGLLLAPNLVYRDDAPWVRERLQSIAIADDAIPHELLDALDVRRLSVHAEEELVDGERMPVEPTARDVCHKLSKRLQSPEFLAGLRRLIRHHHGSDCSPSFRKISTLALQPVASLVTEIRLEKTTSLGRKPVRWYFDVDDNIVLLVGSSMTRVASYVALTINRLLDEHALPNLSPVEHILSCNSTEIGEILDDNRITDDRFDDVPISWSTPESGPDDALSFGDTANSPEEGDEHNSQEFVPQESEAEANFRPTQPYGGSGGYLGGSRQTQEALENFQSVDADSNDTEHLNGADRSAALAKVATSGASVGMFASHSRRLRSGVLKRLLDTNPGDANQTWANARSDQPPLDPGVGRSTVRRGGVGGRFIGMDYENEPDATIAETRDKAIAYVMDFEQRQGRMATRTEDGVCSKYDVLSENPSTDEVRHIEVKGTLRDWRDSPVKMTHVQFDYAIAHREQSWLYVVERLEGEPRLHRIKDPAGQINGFRIDASWAARAEGVAPPTIPIRGMKIYLVESGILLGDIVSVEGEKFPRLTISTPDGSEKQIMYKRRQHRLELANGHDAT